MPPSIRGGTPMPRICWNAGCRCASSKHCVATRARAPTARSTHLTPPPLDVVHATIPALMAALSGCWRPVMPEVADSLEALWARGPWTGVGRTCCPAIVGPWRISSPAGPRPWVGSCGRASTVGRNTTSTTLAATGAVRSATVTSPEAWLEARRQELLPVPSCHVVFTLPPELRELVRRHPKDRYDI